MGIREGWIELLHRAATGTRKTRTLLTPIGAAVFGLFTGLFVFLALLVDRWIAAPWPLSSELSRLTAGLLLATGILVAAWSAFHFLKVKGTPVPFNPPPRLVTSGPYRFVRNPMLTGVFLFLFGLGFGIESPSLVVVFTPLFIAANVWELKTIEEPELVRRLGSEYVEYRRGTPMFIPRVRRGS
jgi:protein-S-isoprenylcysteine O-methyltransferase Ste14